MRKRLRISLTLQCYKAATAISADIRDAEAASRCGWVPISLSADTVTYLKFYGTAIRNRSSLTSVTATINGIRVPVSYGGPMPNFNGLDQVNVHLISILQKQGGSREILTVDGQTSNAVTFSIQ